MDAETGLAPPDLLAATATAPVWTGAAEQQTRNATLTYADGKKRFQKMTNTVAREQFDTSTVGGGKVQSVCKHFKNGCRLQYWSHRIESYGRIGGAATVAIVGERGASARRRRHRVKRLDKSYAPL